MNDRLWREGATPDELNAVARIDRDIANLVALRASYTYERQRITNRACQRARYVPRKKVVASRADSDNMSLNEAGDE
jgi:hypothetical protein